jgi:hypothetical protein
MFALKGAAMGHIDIRFLPRAYRWRAVHGAFESGDPRAIVHATLFAAHDRLTALRGDPQLTYCVWLLMRLASAARRPDFETALTQLGLNPRSESVLDFVADVDQRARDEVERLQLPGPFGEIAVQALASTLVQTMHLHTVPLFGESTEIVRSHLKRYGTPSQLATVLSRFFGEFLERVLRFYLDKALPLHAGTGRTFLTIWQGEVFLDDVSSYARQLADLTADFTRGSYNLQDWVSGGQIPRDGVEAYIAHLFDKLRGALAGRDMAEVDAA